MSAPQFRNTSTAQDDNTTVQDLDAASRFTTKPLGKSSRKKRGALQYSLSCRDYHFYGCFNQRRDREGCRRGNAGQDACVLWTARTKNYNWSVARDP
jgi:hypothetical protein